MSDESCGAGIQTDEMMIRCGQSVSHEDDHTSRFVAFYLGVESNVEVTWDGPAVVVDLRSGKGKISHISAPAAEVGRRNAEYERYAYGKPGIRL